MLAKFYQNYKIAAKCQVPAKGSDVDGATAKGTALAEAALGVGQTKHSQAKPSTQFGNRISCSTSAYSTWLDLRAGGRQLHPCCECTFVCVCVRVSACMLAPPMWQQQRDSRRRLALCVFKWQCKWQHFGEHFTLFVPASLSPFLHLPVPPLLPPLLPPSCPHYVSLTVTRHFLLFAKTFCAKFNCNENFHPLTVPTCESSLTIAAGRSAQRAGGKGARDERQA